MSNCEDHNSPRLFFLFIPGFRLLDLTWLLDGTRSFLLFKLTLCIFFLILGTAISITKIALSIRMLSPRFVPRHSVMLLLATAFLVFTQKTSVAFTSANALSPPNSSKKSSALTNAHLSYTSGTTSLHQHHRLLTTLRGGDGDPDAGATETATPTTEQKSTKTVLQSQQMSAVVAFIMAGASRYSQALERFPIGTKSVTAAVIFMISDLVAQRIERSEDSSKLVDKKRTLTASLVGLLYFGPAAHVWYDNIFRLFPGT